MADPFFFISNIDIASYADDNTSYIAVDNIDNLTKPLEEAFTVLFQWFDNNLKKQPWRVSFTNKQQ